LQCDPKGVAIKPKSWIAGRWTSRRTLAILIGLGVAASLTVVVVSAGLGPFATTPPGTRSPTLYLQVISDSTGKPAAGLRVRASAVPSAETYARLPGGSGPVPVECVQEVPSGSYVLGDGVVVFPNGTTVTFSTCKIDVYITNSTGGVRIDALGAEYYLLVVEYPSSPPGTCRLGCTYEVVDVHSRPITYVTVTIPSGNFTVNAADEQRSAPVL
jgi:hypothetical protein